MGFIKYKETKRIKKNHKGQETEGQGHIIWWSTVTMER